MHNYEDTSTANQRLCALCILFFNINNNIHRGKGERKERGGGVHTLGAGIIPGEFSSGMCEHSPKTQSMHKKTPAKTLDIPRNHTLHTLHNGAQRCTMGGVLAGDLRTCGRRVYRSGTVTPPIETPECATPEEFARLEIETARDEFSLGHTFTVYSEVLQRAVRCLAMSEYMGIRKQNVAHFRLNAA